MDLTLSNVINYILLFISVYAITRFIKTVLLTAALVKHVEACKVFENNNVVIRIEKVVHNEQEVFLVFNDLNNNFVTQGISAHEIAESLKKMYHNRTVLLKTDSSELIVFSEAAQEVP